MPLDYHKIYQHVHDRIRYLERGYHKGVEISTVPARLEELNVILRLLTKRRQENSRLARKIRGKLSEKALLQWREWRAFQAEKRAKGIIIPTPNHVLHPTTEHNKRKKEELARRERFEHVDYTKGGVD